MTGTMIVTGGSRGIGAAIARCAAAEGWKVAVNYAVAADRAEALVAEIAAAGGEAVALQGDVADPKTAPDLFTRAAAALGPVTALVNNAGIDSESLVADLEDADVERIFAVNALGPVYACREAVRRLAKSRGGPGGVIVNVSSISALYGGLPKDAVYAGTKGAVDSFTLGLAREVADDGIRVCGLRPGVTRTEMFDQGIGPEELVKLGRRAVPLGRVGEPEEVAQVVVFLCSDKASYMTGAIVNVSGGRETFVRN